MQEDKINDVSKDIQPYLPRPHYGAPLERSLIDGHKAAHDGPVQTMAEAGIDARQKKDWNAASDQLDWRRRYYQADPGRAARDYSKLLSLDDAMILDVNLSFGLEPDDADRTLPTLSVVTRLYRADTARLLMSREDRLADQTSSTTLSEFRAAPGDLTDRLYALAPGLGTQLARSLASALRLQPPAVLPSSTTPPSAPEATFHNGASATEPPLVSTSVATPAVSTMTILAPPSGSTDTAVSPGTSVSTPTAVSSPTAVSPAGPPQ
jgi:hypothetical protein